MVSPQWAITVRISEPLLAVSSTTAIVRSQTTAHAVVSPYILFLLDRLELDRTY